MRAIPTPWMILTVTLRSTNSVLRLNSSLLIGNEVAQSKRNHTDSYDTKPSKEEPEVLEPRDEVGDYEWTHEHAHN